MDDEDSERALCLVKEGKTPALILKNFYSKELCDIVSTRVLDHFSKKKFYNSKIGVSLVSLRNDKEEYFRRADSIRNLIQSIFEGIEDPRKKIHEEIKKIGKINSIDIAKENDSKYACGIIRTHNNESNSSLHRDNVSFEAPGFDVCSLENQISFVLPFQSSDKGGELQVFHQKWEKTDERFRKIDFGYYDRVIKPNTGSVKIKPIKGDLIIINPNFYHRIQPVSGKKTRITLNMFGGFLPGKNEILTWS
ncbi:MAG: 2OG-Fe(II) oxygenase [Crenarchaeota archaeon]|nr:MAG: 2OG-Fe(II) oxygenase [Thermoproteota archaeon]RDJ33935.1 MAG: 2OG-Fe(II) oxygenase [Thermoproteota archaeon]RDJ36953.1 MAG: 2OG-Fe(II) oxygenase [Thermoproteota archaeon]RDJ37512.1 MAG: 2OG-Fe(II) oxygenase [Thermoproteota archaeon]